MLLGAGLKASLSPYAFNFYQTARDCTVFSRVGRLLQKLTEDWRIWGSKNFHPLAGTLWTSLRCCWDHGTSSRSRAHRRHLAMMAMKTDKGEMKVVSKSERHKPNHCNPDRVNFHQKTLRIGVSKSTGESLSIFNNPSEMEITESGGLCLNAKWWGLLGSGKVG